MIQILSLPKPARVYWATKTFKSANRDLLLLLEDAEEVEAAVALAKFHLSPQEVLWLPSVDKASRHSRTAQAAGLLSEALAELFSPGRDPKLLVTDLYSLTHSLPSPAILKAATRKLTIGQQVSIDDISAYLASNGFQPALTVSVPAEFAMRGEIMDLILPNYTAYRLVFSWNTLSSIKKLDIGSQLSGADVPELQLYPAGNLIKYADAHNQYSSIDYLVNPILATDSLYTVYLKEYFKSSIESADNIIEQVTQQLSNNDTYLFDTGNEGDIKLLEGFYPSHTSLPVHEMLKTCVKAHKKQKVVVCYSGKSALAQIHSIAKSAELHCKEITHNTEAVYHMLNLAPVPLSAGFYDSQYVFISQYNLTGVKPAYALRPSTDKRKLKTLLAEFTTFKQGELVAHIDYGIARFGGIETVQIQAEAHDCLKLIYAGEDVLYVPVENIDALKKYGSDEGVLDKLGSAAWQERRAAMKDRLNLLAHGLIDTAAQRSLATTKPIELDMLAFSRFSAQFPHIETEDQSEAIEAISRDFINGRLSERLICGDVGFGKTEVAMRAAFIVTGGNLGPKMQVAVIVPTTILCRQHYLNFAERFKGFNVEIAELSRLSNTKTQREVKKRLAAGEIDIIIGTHALLTAELQFPNLGLLIVDEEQHFGVVQKEYLKNLKKEIYVLSLSATPIPRSLQMSLVGIRDLSIIATPPIDRLAVKTVVSEHSDELVRDILMAEKQRGGRSFYVSPRIKFLDEIQSCLQKVAPELKVSVAHGKLTPRALDQVMTDFYQGQIDVLLSTAIIESGIDIPEANTIIIDRAQLLGLSQLYQLRGRVGRGKVKGYAHLILRGDGSFTQQARKRLEIMQHVDQLGAGFTIATHDMELRGFGNLIGSEQSGHIKEVGAELYQDMLEAALALKKDPDSKQSIAAKEINPTINLGLPVYLPNQYIADDNTRLSMYYRIGNMETPLEIEQLKAEMIDRFGDYPVEVEHLLAVIKIKQLCRRLHITGVDAGPNGVVFKFLPEASGAAMATKMLSILGPNDKLSGQYKLTLIRKIDKNSVISQVSKILQQLEQVNIYR